MSVIERLLAAKAATSTIAPVSMQTVNNTIADRIAATEQLPQDYNTYADIQRIISLPTYRGLTPEELEVYNRQNILSSAYNDLSMGLPDKDGVTRKGFRFYDKQAEAMAAYESCGGLIANMGVGWGKTLTTLAIAEKAWQRGKKKMLLMIPSSVLPQFAGVDIKWARLRIPISYQIYFLGGRGMAERKVLVDSQRPGLYVWTYSLTSAKDAAGVMEKLKPELIQADEGHNLANMSAARSRRVRDYIDDHKPEFVCLSGTITGKSLKDYYHFLRWALDAGCPMPLSASLANEWASLIDADAGKYGDPVASQTGPLKPLVDWAKREFPEERISSDTLSGFRHAYRLRFNSVNGVVSTGDAEIGTSLYINNLPVKDHVKSPGWETLDKLGKQVTEAWLTPNGDEIEHAIHCWKWLNEIYGAGFYNQLTWPTPEAFAEKHQKSKLEAEDIMERTLFHHATGQVYAKALRSYLLEKARPGCDTPFLVGQDFYMHEGGKVRDPELYKLWQDWKTTDFPGRPDRDSAAVRVCPFKIEAAITWVRECVPKGEGAILWLYHQEVGRWLYEGLIEDGFDAIHAPAGENELILNPANKNKKVVASIKAHGEGKNLQHFHNQYFMQWPRSATRAEQTIGRTHRNGQKKDELFVYTNHTVEFDELNFAACLNDSLYIHQTTGNRQKLIIAGYNPQPRVFPSAVLHERGLMNKMLNTDQQRMLNEKFGG